MATEEQLVENGYPRPSEESGKAVIKAVEKTKSSDREFFIHKNLLKYKLQFAPSKCCLNLWKLVSTVDCDLQFRWLDMLGSLHFRQNLLHNKVFNLMFFGGNYMLYSLDLGCHGTQLLSENFDNHSCWTFSHFLICFDPFVLSFWIFFILQHIHEKPWWILQKFHGLGF